MRAMDRRVTTLEVEVEVDAGAAVVGKLPHLFHPRPDLLIVLAVERRRPGEVREEAVDALHLLLDELHVAMDTIQQQRPLRMMPNSELTAPATSSAIADPLLPFGSHARLSS